MAICNMTHISYRSVSQGRVESLKGEGPSHKSSQKPQMGEMVQQHQENENESVEQLIFRKYFTNTVFQFSKNLHISQHNYNRGNDCIKAVILASHFKWQISLTHDGKLLHCDTAIFSKHIWYIYYFLMFTAKKLLLNVLCGNTILDLAKLAYYVTCSYHLKLKWMLYSLCTTISYYNKNTSFQKCLIITSYSKNKNFSCVFHALPRYGWLSHVDIWMLIMHPYSWNNLIFYIMSNAQVW